MSMSESANVKPHAQTSMAAVSIEKESGDCAEDHWSSRNGIEDDDSTTLASNTLADACDMRRMGKVQQLRRNFHTFSAIAFASCAMGTWELTYMQNTQALIDGGRAGLLWSYVWAYVGTAFVVLSLAEMASMAPTAGGQYHWVSEFAPRGAPQRILSYVSGWFSMLAWQLFIAADTSLCANLVLALVTIQHPETFVVQPYMNTLLIIGVMAAVAAINIFGVRQLPRFEAVFVVLHVSCFVAIVVLLWTRAAATGSLAATSARDVFLRFDDNNPAGAQWPSIGVALLVGQAPALFNVQGSDSVVHIAEEVRDAGVAVPRAMLMAFCFNIPLALGMLVTYIYTLGPDNAVSIPAAISSPTGFPFIYALQQSCGLSTAATTGVVFVMLLLMFMITVSTTAATARQTFAFARDGGVPFSGWAARVNRRYEVPANAVLITAGFTTVMSLIYLGSATAFNALISTSILGLASTYFLSIGCVLIRRVRASLTQRRARVQSSDDPHGTNRSGSDNNVNSKSSSTYLPPARWSLGTRLGPLINVLALAFCLQNYFWCFWPVSRSTEPDVFNWGIVIYGGVMALALVQYLLVARKTYSGPVVMVRKDV